MSARFYTGSVLVLALALSFSKFGKDVPSGVTLIPLRGFSLGVLMFASLFTMIWDHTHAGWLIFCAVGWLLWANGKRKARLELPDKLEELTELCRRYYAREIHYASKLGTDQHLVVPTKIAGIPEIVPIKPRDLDARAALRGALWQLQFRRAESKFELNELYRLIQSLRSATELPAESSCQRISLLSSIRRFEGLEAAHREQDGIYHALGSLSSVSNFTPAAQAYIRNTLGQDYEALLHLVREIRNTNVQVQQAYSECRRSVSSAKIRSRAR